MQAGDRHEVRYAGAAEQAPVLRIDRPLIAYGQCNQYSGGRRFTQCAEKPRANCLAHLLDAVAEVVPLADFLLLASLPDITGRADAPLQKPRFIVEAIRIYSAVRPLEAHREQPAFARMNTVLVIERRGRVLRRCGVSAPVPRQQ